jgi:hypothetical protein
MEVLFLSALLRSPFCLGAGTFCLLSGRTLQRPAAVKPVTLFRLTGGKSRNRTNNEHSCFATGAVPVLPNLRFTLGAGAGALRPVPKPLGAGRDFSAFLEGSAGFLRQPESHAWSGSRTRPRAAWSIRRPALQVSVRRRPIQRTGNLGQWHICSALRGESPSASWYCDDRFRICGAGSRTGAKIRFRHSQT